MLLPYTQNKDGAYFIYNVPMTMEEYEKLVPGTRILVSGYKSSGQVKLRITDAKYEIVEGESFIAEPVDITDMLGSDDLINYQNQYFSVKDMQVVASKDAEGNEVAYIYNWDGSGTEGDDLYFKKMSPRAAQTIRSTHSLSSPTCQSLARKSTRLSKLLRSVRRSIWMASLLV